MKQAERLKAVGAFIIAERTIGEVSSDGIVLPSKKRNLLKVISVGAQCKLGIIPGDLIQFTQGTKVELDEPTPGKEYAGVHENLVLFKIRRDDIERKDLARDDSVIPPMRPPMDTVVPTGQEAP